MTATRRTAGVTYRSIERYDAVRMRLDATTYGHPLSEVTEHARRAEARGFDAWLTSEVAHDPLLSLAPAALGTERMQVGSAIAVAFARNPMSVAYAAHDLQSALGDRRLILGLGTQIRAHIAKRFSSSWPDRPASAMREFVEALQAIWDCWDDGAPLAYEGEFHRHTLMTPMFTPPPGDVRPEVWIAAVGDGMTRVAGQVGDGILCHGFTTARYLEEVTLPALDEGIARVAGRSRDDVDVVLPLFLITGYDDEQRQGMRAMVLNQIGFYGSTPAYRRVLELHGWGELADELHRLSKADGWGEMAAAIPQEVVETFAIIAEPDELGDAIVERFGATVDRVSVAAHLPLTDTHLTTLRETLDRA